MSSINYDNRLFTPVTTSANSEVDGATIFHYRQRDNLVWATYHSGGIIFGTLIATVDAAGALDMRYSHVNAQNELMTGECRSTPEILKDGRLRLHEKWRWTCGDWSSGSSIVEELVSELLA